MLTTLDLSASVLALAGGIALAETSIGVKEAIFADGLLPRPEYTPTRSWACQERNWLAPLVRPMGAACGREMA